MTAAYCKKYREPTAISHQIYYGRFYQICFRPSSGENRPSLVTVSLGSSADGLAKRNMMKAKKGKASEKISGRLAQCRRSLWLCSNSVASNVNWPSTQQSTRLVLTLEASLTQRRFEKESLRVAH